MSTELCWDTNGLVPAVVQDTGTGEVYVGRWLQERAVLDPDDYPGKWGLWKAGDVRKAGAGFIEIRTGG